MAADIATSSKGKGKEPTGQAKWDGFAHLKFIELCENEIRKGNRPGTHFSKDGWKNIGIEFNKLTNRNYTRKQLKNHWDAMKKEWSLWKQLMRGETGLGWDPINKTVTAIEEWWKAKIEMNPAFKAFQNKNLELIRDRYDGLFGDITATGEEAFAPSQSYSTPSQNVNEDDRDIQSEESGDSDEVEIEGTKPGLEDLTPNTEVQVIRTGAKKQTSEFSSRGRKKRRLSGAAMIKEQLDTLMTAVSNRSISADFQHSGQTVSKNFHYVLRGMRQLARDMIKPDPNYNNGAQYHKPIHSRYLPYFKDCIGAIDGTHVKARLPQGQEIPYIGRKGYPTQNILAVCDFNMCFTFVWAGWERTAHDARIFNEALRRPKLRFPHPHNGKYYVVDAGYPHTPGYLAPYKGENLRYHLPDFRRGSSQQAREPRSMKEKFNYLHSSCRNIIERTFGVWKARWAILRDMPFYTFQVQRDIVIATMALHNYIRKKGTSDESFMEAERETYCPERDEGDGDEDGDDTDTFNHNLPTNDTMWMGVRDAIALDIARA